MPNWTSNQITVEGDREQVLKLKTEMNQGTPGGSVFDFNKLIPMPQSLFNLSSGSNTIDGQKCKVWITEKGPDSKKFDRLLTPEEQAEVNATGFESWYDWACHNWGTKWNACNPEIFDEYEGFLEYRFDTAWCQPQPIFDALKKKYPDLDIKCRWRDEDDHPFPHGDE